MPRSASPSAIAVIVLCVIPAPAPCASTRQGRGFAGSCQRPDTGLAPSIAIFTVFGVVIDLHASRMLRSFAASSFDL